MTKARAVVFKEILTISSKCMAEKLLTSLLSGSHRHFAPAILFQRRPVDANTHASPTK